MKMRRQRQFIILTLMKLTLLQTLLLLPFLGLAFTHDGVAQEVLEQRISLTAEELRIRTVLSTIEKAANVQFTYSPQLIAANRKVSLSARNEKLGVVLSALLTPLHISYEVVGKQIVLTRQPAQTTGNVPAEWKVTTAKPAMVAQMVSGQVLDDGGAGLPGVSVVLKGTVTGTTTNEQGRYSLSVPDENAVLVFSYVGYLAQEVRVGNQQIITVRLLVDDKSLSEVVVVGYGTQKRSNLSNAVASISSKDIQNQVIKNPQEAMAGQMPGVQVSAPTGKPGAGLVVRVRGAGSINAGNKPLYVVDGIPLVDDGDLALINPGDIESIDVLKDAASAAIYGSRGGNGVVIITTKKGRAGRTRVDFQYYTGVQEVSKKVALQNGPEHAATVREIINKVWVYGGGDPSVPNGQRFIQGSSLNGFFNYPALLDQPNIPNTDWQNEIFRRAPISNYQLSASGGNTAVRYYLSGNYFTQDGIIKATDYKRYAVRATIDATINPILRIGGSFAPSYQRENRRPTDGHWVTGSVVTTALVMPPWIQARYPGGLYGQVLGNQDLIANSVNIGIFSPLPTLEDPLYKDLEERIKMLGNTYIELEPLKGLVLRSTVGVDIQSYWNNFYRPSSVNAEGSPVLTPGSPGTNIRNIASSHYEYRNLNYLWENTATYNRTFGTNHNLTALAGYSAQFNTQETAYVAGQAGQFANDQVQYVTGATLFSNSNTAGQWSLLSYLGRLNYSFKGKYLLTAAVRRDGSSRFATNNKWATFPSVSAAWRVTDEPFMKPISSWLSDLKLRASYGLTGNFNIGNYSSQALLGRVNYNFGAGDGTLATGVAPTGFANNDLTWETNKQLDLGIDFGFLNDRFTLSLDYYRRVTNNLLYNRPVPSLTGFTSLLGNIGSIENQGFELGLFGRNNIGPVQWTSNLNVSANRNKILALGEKNEPILSTTDGFVLRNEVGRPFNEFYGLDITGVFRSQADLDAGPKWYQGSFLGSYRFRDVNNDGKIDLNDRTYIGNPQPNFIYGFTNRLAYKGFDLEVFLQGVQGGKIGLVLTRFIGNISQGYNNLAEANERFISVSNPGRINGYVVGDNGSNQFSTRYLYDASYLRMRNLTLGYTLPQDLTRKARLQTVRLYATCQNLFTISKYVGYNPEANTYQGGENPTLQGLDYGVYPLPRSYVFGVNLGF